ncbi:lipid-A-disaccharide synthase N-terminal domain-containing protein, partial [Chryseosolibacter indicus]
VYALGFFSQGLFAARLIIQWLLSEKEGRVVSPVIYWQISLVATYLFILYGIFQNDFVIILGQALSYIICVRNLQLEGSWNTMPSFFRFLSIVLPFVTVAWVFLPSSGMTADFSTQSFLDIIMMIGAIGQLLLNVRFLYQWYYAEKTKTSDLPVGFWVMTAVGSVMVVIYALDRFDPVLLFAQGLGLLAAIRNIQLHYKPKQA